MKVDIDQLSKLYYSIGEVSDLFEVNRSLLRYWETEFKQLKPRKKERGSRLDTVDDITLITNIYDLLKVKGYTIEGAKRALNRSTERSVQNEKLDMATEKIKSALDKLKEIRGHLE